MFHSCRLSIDQQVHSFVRYRRDSYVSIRIHFYFGTCRTFNVDVDGCIHIVHVNLTVVVVIIIDIDYSSARVHTGW